MSSKSITKESRRSSSAPRGASSPRASKDGSAPIDIPSTADAIIYSFPSGKPQVNLSIPAILDKSEALDKYTDRNSMLYTYHQMRQDEKKSISALANWEQILREAKE